MSFITAGVEARDVMPSLGDEEFGVFLGQGVMFSFLNVRFEIY
jgi:hypothetical protein